MVQTQTIPVIELASKKGEDSTIELIDVRTPVEFRELHAEYARNVPLDTLGPDKLLTGANGQTDRSVYLICRTGSRARQAAAKLEEAGAVNVFVVEGGIDAWAAAGLPVVRGKKAISLERQVRIAAGSLVLLGSVLAFFASPYFWAIPAFVGAGLIFAGVTDTCGMGILLSKMPWNKVGGG